MDKLHFVLRKPDERQLYLEYSYIEDKRFVDGEYGRDGTRRRQMGPMSAVDELHDLLVRFGPCARCRRGIGSTHINCDWPIEQVIDEIQRVAKIETYLCLHDREDAGGFTDSFTGWCFGFRRTKPCRRFGALTLGQPRPDCLLLKRLCSSADDKRPFEVGLRARKGKETSCSVLGLEISNAIMRGHENLHWYRPIKIQRPAADRGRLGQSGNDSQSTDSAGARGSLKRSRWWSLR